MAIIMVCRTEDRGSIPRSTANQCRYAGGIEYPRTLGENEQTHIRHQLISD